MRIFMFCCLSAALLAFSNDIGASVAYHSYSIWLTGIRVDPRAIHLATSVIFHVQGHQYISLQLKVIITMK